MLRGTNIESRLFFVWMAWKWYSMIFWNDPFVTLLWSNILHNKYSLITSPVHSFSRRNLFLARNASTEIFGQFCSWQVLHGNFRGNDRQIHHILGSKVCIHISPREFDIPDYVILSPCYSLSVLSLINWSGILFCYHNSFVNLFQFTT